MYVKQLGFAVPASAKCEIAITGFCPVELRHKIYHIFPAIEDNALSYKLSTFDESEDDEFVLLLGADKERIEKSINSSRANRIKDINWWRVPKLIISNEVRTRMNASIGGHMQLGIGGAGGFQLFSVFEPNYVDGHYLSYLGLNLTSGDEHIGHCAIGMPGMI